MNIKLIAFFLLVALSNLSVGQQLICNAEMLAGISFDQSSGDWKSGTSRTEKKYLLRTSSDKDLKYEVVKFGSKTVIGFCKDEFDKYGSIYCNGFGSEFFFSRNDMRFISIYTWGYWNEKTLNALSPNRRIGGDTPSIEAGTCAEF